MFSVVIPLYNKEKHIMRAINSVLNQTYQDFELIVVDDGSTDGSFEAASTIQDPRIRIMCQDNRGVSAARNRGVVEAKSNWVAFLDADDEWLPSFLEENIEIIQSHSDCAIIGSAYLFSEHDGSLRVVRPSLPYILGWKGVLDDYYAAIQEEAPFSSSSVVIRKEVLIESGMFPEGINNSEDITTFLKIAINNNICYIYLPLAVYHLEAENRSKYNTPENEKEIVRVGKQLLCSSDLKAPQRDHLYSYIVQKELTRARTLLYFGKRNEAATILKFCQDSIPHQTTINKLLKWTKRPSWLYQKVYSIKDYLKLLINRLDRLL